MADIRFLPYPRFRALDSNGDPLSGGKVNVYKAGTSTRITTWADANKNGANANPVILDANGEADIFFDQSAKIVLTDSNDVQQWSLDNVSPLNAQTVTGKYNLVENGSFELDGDGDGTPDNWTISLFNSSTSTVEIDTSNVVDGTNSLKFVSQGDGGGTATSARFPVPDGGNIGVSFYLKSTAADVKNIVKIQYYDKNDSTTSTTTLYSEDTSNPTSFTLKVFGTSVPAGSTQAELILIGCDSSDSTSGTTYYDLAQVTSQDYVFTGSPGEIDEPAASFGIQPTLQVFTSSGTWNRPSGCRQVIVEVQGAGGAGGGAKATSANEASIGTGGSSGSYSRSKVDVTGISSSTITVGSGGSGSAGSDGGNGGNSSWNDGTNTVTANGGAGNDSSSAGTGIGISLAGSGASAGSGDFTISGLGGKSGWAFASDPFGVSGDGGSSYFGGGIHGVVLNTDFSQAGANASVYGAGGSGAINLGNQTAAAGGDGADGVVIVTEYYV